MKHMVILDKTIVYVKDWKVYIYQYIYIIYSFGKYGKKTKFTIWHWREVQF